MQRVVMPVPDRDGEHAIESRKPIEPVPLVDAQDDLGVAVRIEGYARLTQLAADFAMIVDLAVEHDVNSAVGRMHWLMSTSEVDDAEALHPERDARRMELDRKSTRLNSSH